MTGCTKYTTSSFKHKTSMYVAYHRGTLVPLEDTLVPLEDTLMPQDKQGTRLEVRKVDLDSSRL